MDTAEWTKREKQLVEATKAWAIALYNHVAANPAAAEAMSREADGPDAHLIVGPEDQIDFFSKFANVPNKDGIPARNRVWIAVRVPGAMCDV